MIEPNLIVNITASLDWPSPAENTVEKALRAQANLKVAAAARKSEAAVKLIISEMLLLI